MRLPLLIAACTIVYFSICDISYATVIIKDDFNDGELTGWTVDTRGITASVTERGGALAILAHSNDYAHIERDNSADLVLAKARVKVSSEHCGDQWAPGVVLYWAPGSWTRVALDAVNRSILSSYLIDGKYSSSSSRHFSPRDLFSDYVWLAVEITDSHVNHYASLTGVTWTRTHYLARPASMVGAPTKIILGKGYGTGKTPFHLPDLDNSLSIPGGFAASWIDDFSLTVDEPLVEEPFLRKFPHPYSAALSITSDIDGMDVEAFLTMHQFLNTKQDMSLNPRDEAAKEMGVGIGLEISNSLWMFNDEPEEGGANGMAYFHFDGESVTKTADADLIRTYAHAGYLDCLHSYGHFGRTGGFTRDLALLALEEMARGRISPEVWSNHGDGFNHDNVGYHWNETNLGDLPGSKAYHTDLTLAPDGPVRFIWKFNSGGIVDDPVSEPLSVLELEDGKPVTAFARYYGPGWTVEDLADQIAPMALDNLIASEGYMFVANHLQAGRSSPRVYFGEAARHSLRALEARYRSGRIYVTTTAKLLRYKYALDNLKWSWSGDCDSFLTIEIHEVADPSRGGFLPTMEDLQGLTICTPCASQTKVLLETSDVTHQLNHNNDDPLGIESLSFPLIPLSSLPEWTTDGYTYKVEERIEQGEDCVLADNTSRREGPLYHYIMDVTNIDAEPFAPTIKYVGLHAFSIGDVYHEGLYHIYHPDDMTVRLPLLGPEETIGHLQITDGYYNPMVPRLADVVCDSCDVDWATFDPASGVTSIALTGAGQAELTIENLSATFDGACCRFTDASTQTVTLDLGGRQILETLDFHVTPDGGPIEVIVDEWRTEHVQHRSWKHRSLDRPVSVGYVVGGLTAGDHYSVRDVTGGMRAYTADPFGRIAFQSQCGPESNTLLVTDLRGANHGEFWITQNAPNPFSRGSHQSTICFFALPHSGRASIRVFDVSGRMVAVLADGPAVAGIQKVDWTGIGLNGRPVPSGVYLLNLDFDGTSLAKKLIVIE